MAAVKAGASARARVGAFVDPILLSYSQLLFAGQRVVGALVLAATFLNPRLGALGLGAVLLSTLTVRLAGFRAEQAARGLYGYNPLLVALALGAFLEPSGDMLLLTAVAVVTTVYLQTALESAISYFFNLPVLSLPFVIVTYLALAAAPVLAHVSPAPVAGIPEAAAGLPIFIDGYLRSLGAIVFQPAIVPGLAVFVALAVYSRIAVLLTLVGYAVAALVVSEAVLGSASAPIVVGYNSLLAALALGGVWFVPQAGAFLFAAVAALLTAFVSLATLVALLPVHLPALILPFNLAMFAGLYAMRQRVRDRAPKSVDFAAGAPEVNLTYFRTRLARWGDNLAVRFALPFSGHWTVTQGHDGEHTHQGEWRHAFDFEATDPSGATFSGSGQAAREYFCYRLPVLAVADGTVVKVVRDVPDNPIGQRHPTDPWGNLVILQHGPGLYSLVCHLAPGTVDLAEGQFVRQGARLGLCGNSGRSFVPHLHLQFQSTPRPGAPTVEVQLNEVAVRRDAGYELRRAALPAKGETVRNLDRKDDVAQLLRLPIGAHLVFDVTDARGRTSRETVTSRIDLLNELYLESDRGCRLYYENQGRHFVVYDYFGRRDGVLYVLHAALSRLPFEQPPDLAWDDVVSRRHFRPPLLEWAHDLASPFLAQPDLTLRFASNRSGSDLVVTGIGQLGSREVRTRAVLATGRGPIELSLHIGTETRTARLVEAPA